VRSSSPSDQRHDDGGDAFASDAGEGPHLAYEPVDREHEMQDVVFGPKLPPVAILGSEADMLGAVQA
jgi:hypothetical protein